MGSIIVAYFLIGMIGFFGTLLALPLIGLPSLFLSPGLRPIFFQLALPLIILSYFGRQFFTNVGNGAWWPLLVDLVPENQRGMAAGILFSSKVTQRNLDARIRLELDEVGDVA